jgi:hypothetical protein
MFFIGKDRNNGKKPPKPVEEYYEITCVNTACMKVFTHAERLFQLQPPQEVADYALQGSVGAPRRNASSRNKEIVGIGLFADASNDEQDNEQSSQREEEISGAEARLKEMAEYYFDAKDGSVKCLKISECSPTETPGRAFRRFMSGKANFVAEVVDKYGNSTSTCVCPHCKTRLYPSAGLRKLIVVPIIGVSQSGKTVCLGGESEYFKHRVPHMIHNGWVDMNENEEYIKEIQKSLKEKYRIEATNRVTRLMWQIGNNEEPYTIMALDMPGEHIANTSENDKKFRQNDLKNVLERADSLILIICPEQIELISNCDLSVTGQQLSGKNAEGKAIFRPFGTMLRLLHEDADPRYTLPNRNIPTMLLLTKIDTMKSGEANDDNIDVTNLSGDIQAKLETVINLQDIDVSNGEVDLVALDQHIGLTKEFFNLIIRNEYNRVKSEFVGKGNRFACFAAAMQSADANGQNTATIRVNEPFDWLMAELGIFRRKQIKPVPGSKKRKDSAENDQMKR